MKPIPVIFSLLAFVLACSEQRSDGEQTQTANQPVPATISSAPDSIQDTLMIEGMPEPVTLSLYRAPENWPLQFRTYLPPEMEAETISSGDGDAIQFSFNRARILFFIFPEGSNRSRAQKTAYTALGSASVDPCDNEWKWQWGCYYSGNNPQQVSRILMGEKERRYFYFLIQYPAEYGDGFGPRYQLLLDRWEWGS